MVTACAAAFDDAISPDVEGEIMEFLKTRLAPALLFLFLLATLGASSRYQLRLAAYYDGRADALTLWAPGAAKMTLDEAVAATAADRMAYKEPKTPIEHVTELAKTVAERITPGK